MFLLLTFNRRHLTRRSADLFPDILSVQVQFGVVSNIGQAIPLIHAEFPHPHFHVQPMVALLRHRPLLQVRCQHVFMRLLAPFDFQHQFPLRLGKITQAAHEAFPPFGLHVARSARSLARSDAQKHADFLSRPFINDGLIQHVWRRVVGRASVQVDHSFSFVQEDGLPDLYRFEGQLGGAGCPTRLPNRTFEFWRWFLP